MGIFGVSSVGREDGLHPTMSAQNIVYHRRYHQRSKTYPGCDIAGRFRVPRCEAAGAEAAAVWEEAPSRWRFGLRDRGEEDFGCAGVSRDGSS